MYRIVYKNDLTRVLLLGPDKYEDCIEFLKKHKLNPDDYIIQSHIYLNNDLKHFLELIEDKENVSRPEKFIQSRKIIGGDIRLICSYISGGAYIKGLVFDKSVEVIFNVYQYKTGYTVIVDGKEVSIPLGPNHIRDFFETGRLYDGVVFAKS